MVGRRLDLGRIVGSRASAYEALGGFQRRRPRKRIRTEEKQTLYPRAPVRDMTTRTAKFGFQPKRAVETVTALHTL